MLDKRNEGSSTRKILEGKNTAIGNKFHVLKSNWRHIRPDPAVLAHIFVNKKREREIKD